MTTPPAATNTVPITSRRFEWENSPFEWTYLKADPELYKKWIAGVLFDEWFAQFGEPVGKLLRLYDVVLAGRGRPKPQYAMGNHYAEWSAALHFHEEGGWLALIEKYTMERRRSPVMRPLYELASDVMGDALTITRKVCDREGTRGQPPDLVLYRPPASAHDWFFCEVSTATGSP